MNMLTQILMAGGQNAGASNSGGSGLIMILLIIVIFYFFMIRPQTKRQKEEKKFRETLSKGQEVVTISGLHGKIKDVKEATVLLEIANNVVVELEKSSIAMNTAAAAPATEKK